MSNHVGTCIGNYRLISLLGQGGFSKVYLAKDISLDRQVAIKVFNTTLPEQEKQRCFQEDAELMEQMQYPHILPVLASGMTGDKPYIVMHYAAHGSLRDRLTRGEKAPLSDIVSCITQIANALQYVHDQHIIHRDIKPENLLFNENDQVLLADFGLASLTDEVHRRAKTDSGTEPFPGSQYQNIGLTATGQYSPTTLVYMAPEQFQGRASTKSDQYALAVTLYEWLTGQPPFLQSPQEAWVDWAQEHQNALLLTPSQLDPSISPEIDQVILKALAKQPRDRYADVATFAAAFQLAAERKQEKERSYPIAWYRQRLEEYEQVLRTESLSEQETPLDDEKPLTVLIECLTKPYMEKALIHLSWMERSCLLLHIDAQFTPDEIAEILNIEPSCVHMHLENGRQLLLDTYYFLLEKEQGISPGHEPSHAQKKLSHVDRLMQSSS